MSNKHLLFRSEGEHFNFLVAIPWTPELTERIQKRGALAEQVGKDDDSFSSLGFFFYSFDVYEDADMDEIMGEDVYDLLVDELPEGLGDVQRKDYGEMKLSTRGRLYFQFAIKHVHETHETSTVDLSDEELFPKN